MPKKEIMLTPALSGMLQAVSEPAMLIRPEDRTVAAVNSAFRTEYGSRGTEGRRCWEALHRANECTRCGFECPLGAETVQQEASCEHTVYGSTSVTRSRHSVRPIHDVDGRVLFWLEKISTERLSGAGQESVSPIVEGPHSAALLKNLEDAAACEDPVLFTGARGAAKELYARTVHENSPHIACPFVCVTDPTAEKAGNGAGLFGDMKRGVFVPGLIDRAQGGTLYIPEISRLEKAVQKRLLAALKDGQYVTERGRAARPAAVRLMAGSIWTPAQLSGDRGFLPEFAQLLAQRTVTVPSLAARREDISPLSLRLVKAEGHTLTPQALEALTGAQWPGDFRALSEAVRKACRRAHGKSVTTEDLDLERGDDDAPGLFVRGAPLLTVDELRDRYIAWVMKEFSISRAELARRLQVSERTLYRFVANAKIARKDAEAKKRKIDKDESK